MAPQSADLRSGSTPTYRGRFAPTPSGPLHRGSLLTALASYLEARSRKGRWLLRIDDLDSERVDLAAERQILLQLEAHGLHWDEPPRRQSQQLPAYRAALERLERDSALYPCTCTRTDLARNALAGPDGPVYAGTCRAGQAARGAYALRLRVTPGLLVFGDRGLGRQQRELASEVGDFVVRRRDGVIAYQLACAIDEVEQGITEVVRGADLLGSTFCQLHLLQRLDLPAPAYRHVPVLGDTLGRKLSKQNRAPALVSAEAADNLRRCLDWLGQRPPPALSHEPVAKVLDWALGHWNVQRIPTQPMIEVMSL